MESLYKQSRESKKDDVKSPTVYKAGATRRAGRDSWSDAYSCKSVKYMSSNRRNRRKSRAVQKAPIPELFAQDKAHFKTVVHYCTGKDSPFQASLLKDPPYTLYFPLPVSPAIAHASSLPSPYPPIAPLAHANIHANSSIAQSLRSTLHTISSCLDHILHSSSLSDTMDLQNSQLGLYKGKAQALLQALHHSELHMGGMTPCEPASNPNFHCLKSLFEGDVDAGELPFTNYLVQDMEKYVEKIQVQAKELESSMLERNNEIHNFFSIEGLLL